MKRVAIAFFNAMLALVAVAIAAAPAEAGSSRNGPAGAQSVVFGFVSDPGDYLGGGRRKTFTSVTGPFYMAHVQGAVLIEYDGGLDESWSLAFQAPRGSELTPGVYEDAANNVSPRKPAVDISGEHRFCAPLKGRFVVLEAVYGPGASVERFAVDFELRCEPEDPIFFGYLRIDSTVPPPATRTPTPTPRPDHFVLTFQRSSGPPTVISAADHTVRAHYYLFPWGDLRPHVSFAATSRERRDRSLHLVFASPLCRDLVPGTFENATEIPWEALADPAIRLSDNFGTFCGDTGRFEIHEAQYGEAGEVYRFVADFELHCARDPSASRSGSVSFISIRPTPTPARPTPTPTDYSSLATLYSELGEFIGHCTQQYLTLADGDFTASHADGKVTILFEGGPNSWVFRFGAAPGEELVPGHYTNPRGPNVPDRPYMNISGQGRGNTGSYGQFVVLEAEYGPGTEVLRFAADFDQPVSPNGPALYGTVRFHSSLPPPVGAPPASRHEPPDHRHALVTVPAMTS